MGTALVVYRKHFIKPGKKKQIRTICEVLREMHRSADEKGDAWMMTRVSECYDMAKRMQRKLEEYNPKAPYIVSDRI